MWEYIHNKNIIDRENVLKDANNRIRLKQFLKNVQFSPKTL